MRRVGLLPLLLAGLTVTVMMIGALPAAAQTTFQIPFNFESGGKKFTAGSYLVTKTGDGQVTFKQVTTGKETALPFTGKLDPPSPPAAEARLVFDEVGNFEPSYTEYFTVYVLAEVWLSGQEGYRIHTTKGAHKTKVVAGLKS